MNALTHIFASFVACCKTSCLVNNFKRQVERVVLHALAFGDHAFFVAAMHHEDLST